MVVGTYQVRDESVLDRAIVAALDSGYRSFDTAAVYENESFLASVLYREIVKRGIKRADIFVTTKLSPKDQGHVKATQAINDSLERLKPLGYVDLFLIHWPGASGLPVDSIENETLRMESWQVLADIVDQKDPKVRFIGVSNFEVKHLSDVFLKIHVPYINQIEIHPFFHNKSLIDFCQDKGIRVQAYSSFGRGTLLNIPQVIQVAKECGLKSTSQVLLRWAIQHGFLVIPKSINPERITVNADIFSFNLSEAQMDFLDNLEKGQKVCWNPSTVA